MAAETAAARRIDAVAVPHDQRDALCLGQHLMARNDDRGRECPASAAQRQAPSARSASRGWGPRTGRPLPEAMVLKGIRSNSQIPTSFPLRFPLNSHALTSVEGLLGQDEIDAAIQTTSTSKARRVDFGGCGPAQPRTRPAQKPFAGGQHSPAFATGLPASVRIGCMQRPP